MWIGQKSTNLCCKSFGRNTGARQNYSVESLPRLPQPRRWCNSSNPFFRIQPWQLLSQRSSFDSLSRRCLAQTANWNSLTYRQCGKRQTTWFRFQWYRKLFARSASFFLCDSLPRSHDKQLLHQSQMLFRFKTTLFAKQLFLILQPHCLKTEPENLKSIDQYQKFLIRNLVNIIWFSFHPQQSYRIRSWRKSTS